MLSLDEVPHVGRLRGGQWTSGQREIVRWKGLRGEFRAILAAPSVPAEFEVRRRLRVSSVS